jgi:hypothetical protein
MPKSEFVWLGSSGCLLPFLIIFNLLFGRFIFGSVLVWLGVEILLILIFGLKIRMLARKISRKFTDFSQEGQRNGPKGKIIDVQGQVVEEDKKLE